MAGEPALQIWYFSGYLSAFGLRPVNGPTGSILGQEAEKASKNHSYKEP